jgi:GNAT superfamily N-acetyltransferase
MCPSTASSPRPTSLAAPGREPAGIRMTTLAERPDLLPVVARWLRERHAPGHTPGHGPRHGPGFGAGEDLATVECRLASRTARLGPEQCFVLFADGVPAGTASLTHRGLESRPELTPWLANVFVVADLRGRGYGTRLVAAVEAAGRRAAISTLWLYTRSADSLYARMGWRMMGKEIFCGDPVTLMRRDLAAARSLQRDGSG